MPVLGRYVLSILIVISLSALAFAIYEEISSTNAYNVSFSTKSTIEKRDILLKLNKNDLILLSDSVYKIDSINPNSITILKSNVSLDLNKTNAFKNIQAELFPDSSFATSYEIDKEDFYNGLVILDNSAQMVLQVLNR